MTELTRKDKADLIDAKIIEFEDNFAMMEEQVSVISALLETKID